MASTSEQVAGQLRSRIVRGQWLPGSRLPDRKALARDLGSCLATLQDAMTQLVDEGFVEVGSRKKGTRVAENPPHLCRYRLIFPRDPNDWGQFWHALEAAARQRTVPEQEILCFYGLSGHRDIAEYQEVVREVQTKRVAGLIFASSADELRGTPLLEESGLPRVAIAVADQLPGIPKVSVDLDHFLERAIDFLLAQGRRRIAVLCACHARGVHIAFRQAMAARGLASRNSWEQFASLHNPLAAGHLMELLLQRGQPERPDALIVTDDNLITAATAGIARTGVRVPEELAILALTNFPNVLPTAVPVTRIGFDAPALLDLLVLRVQQISRGETPPEHTPIPAQFEDELSLSPPQPARVQDAG